jgi:hypothetical protein
MCWASAPDLGERSSPKLHGMQGVKLCQVGFLMALCYPA